MSKNWLELWLCFLVRLQGKFDRSWEWKGLMVEDLLNAAQENLSVLSDIEAIVSIGNTRNTLNSYERNFTRDTLTHVFARLRTFGEYGPNIKSANNEGIAEKYCNFSTT